MNLKQIFTIAIIAMFLIVPFASAKQESVDVGTVKQDKKIKEKAVDKTKEQPKEVKNKDKEITGKITVTDSNTSAYTVTKEGDAAIKIKRSGEHTKAKVTIPKEELQKIDEDGDQLYGVLHIADDGTTTHGVVTESQLTSGIEMIFSENIVNGFSGYDERTYTGVTSGTILNIPDVSGSDYYVTVSVNGTIPTYTWFDDSNINTYPSGAVLAMPMDNGTDIVSGNVSTNTNVVFSNGMATFNGVDSKLTLKKSNAFNLPNNISIVAKINTSNGRKDAPILSLGSYNGPYALFGYGLGTRATLGLYAYGCSGSNLSYSTSSTSLMNNTPSVVAITRTGIVGGTAKLYLNNVNVNTDTTATGVINYPNVNMTIGGSSSYYFPGKMDYVAMYNRILTNSELSVFYAGGSGISMRPSPSYNFTGYNVAAGVEKIIDTDNTCTGIEYIDTTGGTHTVTVRVYFTEDITKTTETKGAVYQNVSIVHTKQTATASMGTIAWELDPLYSGTPVLSSNNTNATVSRNDTHAIISTGLVKQGQSFSYAVSVPDNHDHIIFLNKLMKWMGSGWDYVGVAPEDWTDAITDIKVIVS